MQKSSKPTNTTLRVHTTIEDIVTSFAFGPDCKIDAFLAKGKPSLQKVLQDSLNYRLISVNGHPVADSGELKVLLLRLSASVKGNAEITVEFQSTLTHGTRVNIENSVEYDGKVSDTKKAEKHEVKELVGLMRPEEATAITSPTTDTEPTSEGPGNVSFVSDASSSEFDTVQIQNLPSKGSTPTTSTNPNPNTGGSPNQQIYQNLMNGMDSASPALLEFEKMKFSMKEDSRVHAQAVLRDVGEMTVKGRLLHAIQKVECGCCVICVAQEMNPIAEIELLAMSQQTRVVSLDLGVKLRMRPKPDAVAVLFKEAVRSGAWFVMVNAQKSISTCNLIADILTEAAAKNFEGFDRKSRIIISLEPHPHFPKRLIQGSSVVKLVSNLQGGSVFADSMATSLSRNRLVTADALSASMMHGAVQQQKPTDTTDSVKKKAKKEVKISAAVDVVEIAPREVIKAPKKDSPIDVSGSVALLKTFSGVLNDKFLCVRSAGEPGRFAVGSSFGNVYFLDSLGNSLLQAHAHNASIWDVSFTNKYHFATGCEDGTSASWTLGTGDDPTAETSLIPTSATSLGADVYCVSYLRSQFQSEQSPLLIGGLHNSLVIRSAASEEVVQVRIPSNAQVVDTLPSSDTALVGGGDGSVTIIDVNRGESLAVLTEHSRKLPSLTVRDDSHFFTGSFDSSILSWDLRVPRGVVAEVPTAHTMHTLKLKNYVTGLDVDDVHLAASVGENLYLWDVRKLNTVLGGYPQGWKGLSRGIKIQSSAHVVVTASPDGYVRFWNFV
ncbi:hypothetical protein AGDE_13052 [Angomonas deanei]|uniref:Dynein heavy chain region D6 P-loop domain containing protein, putative n=1 Tax=Angomonas deanei TaxID=59799 RepID=A0A7G2C996_9TRYP|nr:hypothetical protein AGDE_13052 [Angomonas deanei]CAD2215621.1 Dynein heavy chain region D6 P-loop domain containing protein, putative [Angomonas deanei]|eukprot:EPY22809.1 hypothetical protein AGDE_13052 [Angomonas deanei]